MLGILAGAASFFASTYIVTLVGLYSGRVKPFVFPQAVPPRPIESWEILTDLISVAVGALASIFVFRYCLRSRRS